MRHSHRSRAHRIREQRSSGSRGGRDRGDRGSGNAAGAGKSLPTESGERWAHQFAHGFIVVVGVLALVVHGRRRDAPLLSPIGIQGGWGQPPQGSCRRRSNRGWLAVLHSWGCLSEEGRSFRLFIGRGGRRPNLQQGLEGLAAALC